MAHEVFLDQHDIINIVYSGKLNADEVAASAEEAREFTNSLSLQELPLLVLVNVEKMGHPTKEAQKDGVQYIKHAPYDKVALFGGGDVVRHLVNFTIKASGRGNMTKYFKTEADARDWLLVEN